MDIGGTKYFYFVDHLGSIRELTDNSGIDQQVSSFDSYGRRSSLVESLSSDFTFAGYYLHARSNLQLTLHRQYSSALGRWLSRDTGGKHGNQYAYASNPISFLDPLGLDDKSWTLVIQWYYLPDTGVGYHANVFLLDENRQFLGGWSGTRIGDWIGGSVGKQKLTSIDYTLALMKGAGKTFDQDIDSGCNQAKELEILNRAFNSVDISRYVGKYHFLNGPTSNTVAYMLLHAAGEPVTQAPVYAPGFNAY